MDEPAVKKTRPSCILGSQSTLSSYYNTRIIAVSRYKLYVEHTMTCGVLTHTWQGLPTLASPRLGRQEVMEIPQLLGTAYVV